MLCESGGIIFQKRSLRLLGCIDLSLNLTYGTNHFSRLQFIDLRGILVDFFFASIIFCLIRCLVCLRLNVFVLSFELFKFFLCFCKVFLQFLERCLCLGFFQLDLTGIHGAVLVILRQQVVIGLAELLHVAVFARGLGGGGDEALFVAQLHRLQLGLRLLELVRLLGLERH